MLNTLDLESLLSSLDLNRFGLSNESLSKSLPLDKNDQKVNRTRKRHTSTMSVQQEVSVIAAPDPQVDQFERHGYLFGYPIAHSYSPLVHNTVFQEVGLPWGFQLLESTDISQFLRLLKDDRLYGMLTRICDRPSRSHADVLQALLSPCRIRLR